MTKAKHIATASGVRSVDLADVDLADDQGQGTAAFLNRARSSRQHAARPALRRDGGKAAIVPAPEASTSGLTHLYSPGSGVETASPATAPGSGEAAGASKAAASPFVINISWDASVSAAPAGFQSAVLAAAKYLEGQFVDPVTINISVGYGEVHGAVLGSGQLAQTSTYLNSYSYSALRSALSADATSPVDSSFVSSLSATAPLDGTFWATTAEAKALGLAPAAGADTDGYIGFSSSYPFAYNGNARIASGTYDFNGLALHEMTEVMGRLMLGGTTIGGAGNSDGVLDLMHYSSAGVRESSTDTPGYSSVNGGQTSLGTFSTSGGDGGDWASSVADDAFDATPASGVVNTFSASDLSEMDALGWNVAEAPAPAYAPNAPTETTVGSSPSGDTSSTTAMPSVAATATPSVTAAAQVPASRRGSPDDYNSVFGKALNVEVPSETPSSEGIQVISLPTNGTLVLSDGSTPVAVGNALTPAQAAGLRFKSNGAASSSQFDFDKGIAGTPLSRRSISLPFNPTTNDVTPTTTAPINAAPSIAIPSPTAAPLTAAPTIATSAPITTSGAPNAIVLENQKPGTPASVWQIAPGQDSTIIQGFTTSISTPVRGTVQFKINNQTGNGNYQIQVYRLGYYGGNGATLVTTLNHTGSPVVQPNAPLNDLKTGLNDAGNWSVTDSWAVPSTATSGVYMANVIDGSSIFQIPFVVTNPSSTSDIVFQTSDETWQAYNGWGGDSLYGGNGPSAGTPGAAFAVSYNRPIVTRDSIGTYAGPQDSVFGAEYSSIYWLEQNGYDTSYISGIDAATNGSLLLNHKVFMDSGHDEYWTDSQVANVEAANKAGVSLAFLSGNEVFWQTRLSPSINSSADPNRTLVSYKDTHSNQKIDPSGTATGTFQDPRFGTAPEPSNMVTGTLFQVDQTSVVNAITIPYGYTNLRFWRNTSVAQTAPGQTASLEPNLLGYEWDSSPDNGYMPAGLIGLSSTASTEPAAYNTDWGNVDTSGTATHNLVEYRDPTSGALVFGAGTVFWSWGLTNQHDNSPSPFSSSTPDPNVQQATVNFLADMGVQPQTLQASLVIASQSTDKTPPKSTISSVSSNSVAEGQTVTVTGTATDAGSVIGGVQVSADGGQTWHPAGGQVGSATMNWSYSFAAAAPGTYTIKSRAVDDNLNLETPGAGVSYSVTPSTALNLFSAGAAPAIASDASAVEVGVKFTAATTGVVTGIRFYKGSGNTGTHVGDLWSASGALLATATFTNETASGWQQVNFSSPISINAGTTYVASYHTNTGHYADTPYYFATYQGQSTGSLNAPGDSLNGVFAYGANSIFPDSTSTTADNYWVDLVFNNSGRLPPVLGNVAASAIYAVGGDSAALSPSTSVSDPQSANLVSGSASITSGLAAGDTLAASTAGTSISASYNASTGVLSLTGSDTLAHYQQVLDSVTYSSSSQNPTNYGADSSRTVSWVVNDGSVNSAAQTTTVSLTGGPSTASLFSPTATPGTVTSNDPAAVDLGVKFQASTSGTIVGIRFYKGPQNTGTHVGDLWSSTGTLLASATFTNETASGWQQVNFASPVSIVPGTTYIASYEAPNGEYSEDDNFFTNAVTNGPLTAPSNASSGGNGVYAYGSSNPFPNNTFSAANYYVDVVFAGSTPLSFTTPASVTGTAQEGSVLTAGKAVSSDPNAAIAGYQWQGSSDGGATWSAIAGATAATYTPVEADETHLLRVVETATDAGTSQSGTSASAATAAVADIALAFTSAAAVTGSAAVGSTLTAVKGALNDADAAVTDYQWQASTDGTTWTAIAGATSATYNPVAADQGHQLRVAETATDADGGPSTTSNSAATGAVAAAAAGPSGFTFAPATSSLQSLEGGGASLAASRAVGTFTQTGGVAGDSFTYTLSGSSAFVLSSSANQGVLSTGSKAVAGGTVAALFIQVNDVTKGSNSGPLPFDIFTGSSGADTINLSTLGIAASTPAAVYGLARSDTLNGSGMTGRMWFIGGAGADKMTGGSGPNSYLYAAASDSTPSSLDVITNFNAALDKIDLTGVGTTALSFLSTQVSSTIAARSIGMQQTGGNTFVYVNTSTVAETLGSANMKIQLNGTIPLLASNVLHN